MGERLHVSLVSVPEVFVSTLGGLYDVLRCFAGLSWLDDAIPEHPPFDVQVLADRPGPAPTASGVPFYGQLALADVDRTDIVIIPATMVEGGDWKTGRHPELVRWMRRMHEGGAMLCSACSGALLLAETGLLDGRDATMHWAFAHTFRERFPATRLRVEEPLIVTGDRDELVMSGAASSWIDLVLYLIARHVSPGAARAVAKYFAFDPHAEGLAAYVPFEPHRPHHDAAVRDAQKWLADHYADASLVGEVVRRSGLAPRTFKRRFKDATGHSVLDYVQRLRIEQAKRMLERTDAPVDEIGWSVGYGDPTFFRRLFKRVTGLPPGRYRRKLSMPGSEPG